MITIESLFKEYINSKLCNMHDTHGSIINLMRIFKYEANDDGVCFGLSTLAIQASLSNQSAFIRFNRRLALIPMLAPVFEKILKSQWNKVCKKQFSHFFNQSPQEEDQKHDIYYAMQDHCFKKGITYKSFFEIITKSSSQDELIKEIFLRIEKSIDWLNTILFECTDPVTYKQYKLQLDALIDLNSCSGEELLSLAKEVPAFLETTEAYMNSRKHGKAIVEDINEDFEKDVTGVYKNDYNQRLISDPVFAETIEGATEGTQSWSMVQTYYGSDELLKVGGLVKGLETINVYSNEQLANLFSRCLTDFDDMLDQITFQLKSCKHGISAGYDSKTQLFWLFDPSIMPTQYFETPQELVIGIRKSFAYQKNFPNDAIGLAIDLVCTKKSIDSSLFRSKLKSFKKIYAIQFEDNAKKLLLGITRDEEYDFLLMWLIAVSITQKHDFYSNLINTVIHILDHDGSCRILIPVTQVPNIVHYYNGYFDRFDSEYNLNPTPGVPIVEADMLLEPNKVKQCQVMFHVVLTAFENAAIEIKLRKSAIRKSTPAAQLYQLSLVLREIYDAFHVRVTTNTRQRFINKSLNAIRGTLRTLENHRDILNCVESHIKAISGELATISLIPVADVSFKTSQGNANTFFCEPPIDFASKKREIEEKFNKQIFPDNSNNSLPVGEEKKTESSPKQGTRIKQRRI